MSDPDGPFERYAMFDRFTDLITVLDTAGEIVYINQFCEELLGFTPTQLVGRSLAEVLHPDDVERALDVMLLLLDDRSSVRASPTTYRLLTADGGEVTIETNGEVLDNGEIFVIGRVSVDALLQGRLMAMLSTGAPMDQIMPIVPEFGTWRHEDGLYAACYTGDDGRPRTTGSALALELIDACGDGADAPWNQARRTGDEVYVRVDDAPTGPWRDLAQRHALTAAWSIPVADPHFPTDPAVLIGWTGFRNLPKNPLHHSMRVMLGAAQLVLRWRDQRLQLEAAARRDPLTGVTNRTGFFELLDEDSASITDPPLTAVLYVDLDHFKAVNDANGHATGDAVLRETVARLDHAVRHRDTIARLGGDEFAVLCPDISHAEDAIHIAERIIAGASEPITVGPVEVVVGASVGIGIAPTGSMQADELVDLADRALYEAKAAGRGQWRMLEPPPAP